MSQKELLDALAENIKQSKTFVDLGKSVQRLMSNKDFLAVVKTGYFEREAIRLVHLKADQSMQKPETQASIVSQMDAIGHFAQFLRTVEFNAAQAARNIAADEASIEEINAEELAA